MTTPVNPITEKLDRLAELHAALDVMNLLKQDEINKVLTPEIKASLDAIDAEFSEKFNTVTANIAALEAEIKSEVLTSGSTVKGTHFMAVFNKPRVTWDGKLLEGFVIAHPELEKARKVGDASVTFRKV